MHLFRKPVLTVAGRPQVERFIRDREASRKLVARFVAGETLDTALDAVVEMQRAGITATLDELGENVASDAEAAAAASRYVATLQRMSELELEPNISIKLTMLGLDLGDEVAIGHLVQILAAAQAVNGFVRIDMEGSAYVDRTMRIFESVHDTYPQAAGIVIQTYLRRARADVERMIERRARVRLVKGAYSEPEVVAYQSRAEIDDNYRRLAELLLLGGNYPALATHDPLLIEDAQRVARSNGIDSERYEFQMLYGVRRDAQTALVKDGYRMRVYVPYGTHWYPYFSRRIAERPANAMFVLRQLISR